MLFTRRFSLFTAASLVAIAACDGKGAPDDTVQIQEKEDSEESAVLAGWQIQAQAKQSKHPLANGVNETVEISAPDTALKMRLHFTSIRMEKDYDFISVQDEWGTEIEKITGNWSSYTTKTISGKKAKLVITTDGSVQSWGYQLAQIRFRGCAHNDPKTTPLAGAQSCTALRSAIRDIAINEVRRRFTEGYFGGPILYRRAESAPEPGAKAALAHSETNVQVAGVDEADIVKTDGNFTYQISGHQLRVFRTWPAAQTSLASTVNIEGYPKEMFLDGGRVTILSGVPGDAPVGVGGPGPRPLVKMAPIWWNPEAFTKVTVLDMRGGTPRVESETLLAGIYQNARRVGSSYRVLMQRQLKWPEIRYQPDNVEWGSKEYEAALEQLEADAIRIVTDRALADWLPKSYRIENGRRVPLPVECSDFLIPTGSDEPGLTSVVTLTFGGGLPTVQDTSLLVSSGEIYQSASNLYLTSSHAWSCYEDAGTRGQFTYVHKLDVSRADRTNYLATGGFPGAIYDQFALDEHQGFLRVAATNTRWSATTPEQQNVSRVFVLGQAQNRLETVGQTADIAPGERIFSVRFLEDRGFVVTFKQVDPLFTIDLRNPRAPRIVGELTLPGFSTYLHPLDATHVFGLGNDFEADGRTRNGVALTIFDVADLSAPRVAQKITVGTTHGYSEALYEHKAFTTFRQPGSTDLLVAIPFTDWEQQPGDPNYWGSFVSTLKVFRLNANSITPAGDLDHSGLYAGNMSADWGWWYLPQIRRGVFVEGFTYAISDAGIRVAETGNLRNVVAQVAVPAQTEEPTQTPAKKTVDLSDAANVAIPDNNPRGVSRTLEIADDLEVERLTVSVNVKHSYRGDLIVTLAGPAGTTETLFNRTGGSTDDIAATVTTERFLGLAAKGRWTLKVVDAAAQDVGTLVDWSLHAEGKDTSGTTPVPSTPVDRSFESTTKVGILDNDARGVSSDVEVPYGFTVQSAKVTVNITHTYVGDLRVVLVHDGKEVTLHANEGGSTRNLDKTYTVDAWNGADGRGTWKLKVIDTAALDTGSLDGWKLDLTGVQRQ